jgi:uncharacterized SAM-binding protein YcdF (DUF218 family)
VVGFLLVAFTPLVDRLASRSPRPGAGERADAIVVLGAGGLRDDGSLSDSSLRRTYQGIALWQAGHAPLLVFSGPPSGPGVEALARAALARTCGVPAPAILVEARARTTREEALRIAALLRPHGARRVLLVADAEGMDRAARAFERVGFVVLEAPVTEVGGRASPEARLGRARRLATEALAWVYYRLAGYI